MYESYGDRVAFLFVYIREAHPEDEWQMSDNKRDGVVFEQPSTFAARTKVARSCSKALRLTMPCLVDELDNRADTAYAAWPERLFVVDVEGRIAVAGKQGPFGFDPNLVRRWLRRNVGRARASG